MSLDGMKELSRRAIEMWSSNNNDRPEDLFAVNYINHQEPDVEGGSSSKNLEEWKKLVGEYHKSFSDSRVSLLRQIAEGDLVATHWEITAKQTGDFKEISSTGTEVSWRGVSIDKVNDGKISESWVNWDKFSFLDGLGLV